MSRRTLKVSEIFYSIQGEGRFAGIPSVFLRLFGCNFTCRGFGQPRDPAQWIPESEMLHHTEDLTGVTDLSQLQVPKVGCDSSASWAPRYAHLSQALPEPEVAARLAAACPHPEWRSPGGEAVHLVITGGEPLLKGWQRAFPALLAEPPLGGLRHLTFETNGTQPLTPELRAAFEAPGRPYHLNFSVSPKLSASGEAREDAIRPEILRSYAALPDAFLGLKFVVGGEEDVAEVLEVVAELKGGGCRIDAVFLMPVGSDAEDYGPLAPKIAALAMAHGLRYSPRLQIDLFRNKYGT